MQLLVAQACLLVTAVSVVYVGARRYRRQLRRGEHEVGLQTRDALSMPLTGSLLLLGLYVLLRYVPKAVLTFIVSSYLCSIGVVALGMFIRPYVRPRPLTGIACVALGVYYFVTRSWVVNDVLAVAMAVVMLENVPIGSFATSFVMLAGLFVYDVVWVFGTDVMLTVATGIDGPIKIVVPRTLWGSHEKKSLLGLGDIVIPGFFVAQTLVFSRDAVRRGNTYFVVALVAYTAALINTMVVMVVFAHGQPALLYIVPWLLLTFVIALVYKGDVRAAWAFDALTVFARTGGGRVGQKKHAQGRRAAAEDKDEETSLWSLLVETVLTLFGLDADTRAAAAGVRGHHATTRPRAPRTPAPKRNAKNTAPPPPILAARKRVSSVYDNDDD